MTTIIDIRGIGTLNKSIEHLESISKMVNVKGVDHLLFEYQSVLEGPLETFFNLTFKKPPALRFRKLGRWKARQATFNFIGDATAYADVKDDILKKLNNFIFSRLEKGEDIIFMCHSLGCLVAFDAINENKMIAERTRGLITMGCNIPLFRIRKTREIIHCMKAGSWINYYESNDLLGMPLKHMNVYVHQSQVDWFNEMLIDKKFTSWNVFKSWNILAHLTYWNSGRLKVKIEKDIKELLKRPYLCGES